MPHPSKKFRQNPFTTFSVIRRTDRQTDRQTDRSENITSFGGGKYAYERIQRLITAKLTTALATAASLAVTNTTPIYNQIDSVLRIITTYSVF